MKRRVLCLFLTLCMAVSITAQTAFGWSDQQASLYTQFGETNGLTTQRLGYMEEIYAYLTVELKLNTAVACGLLASMYRESRFDPTAGNGSGTALGIVQWYGGHKTWLINWCTENGYDPYSLNGQLVFLKHQFQDYDKNDGYNGTYFNKIYQYLLTIENSAAGAYAAGDYFCRKFEIPSKSQMESTCASRGNLAQNTYYPFFCQIEATGGPDYYDPDSVLPFRDVRTSDWFYSYVVYAYQKGMVSGISATDFSPNTGMSRAMAVQILYNISGASSTAVDSGFSDVSSSAWYAQAVTWARNVGVTNGTSATTFDPDAIITREAMVRLLYNYYTGYLGRTAQNYVDLSGYSDYTALTYGLEAMQWAVGNGIINGVADYNYNSVTLQPKATCTRAQACKMLVQFVQTFM